jgi:hypothetical protein
MPRRSYWQLTSYWRDSGKPSKSLYLALCARRSFIWFLSTLALVQVKRSVLVVALAILTSCGGTETWIRLAPNRPAILCEQVKYLENPPQRPHIAIGIITPPSGEYENEAEAV